MLCCSVKLTNSTCPMSFWAEKYANYCILKINKKSLIIRIFETTFSGYLWTLRQAPIHEILIVEPFKFFHKKIYITKVEL